MRGFAGWILAVVVALAGAAQAKGPKGAGGWGAVERLKSGTKVVVQELGVAGDYRYQVPCDVVRVDDASLICRPEDELNRIIVYPIGRVLTVYRVKMRVTAGSWARIVGFSGLGFLLGCAFTDENANYPLGGLGAAAGAGIGLGHMSRQRNFEVVYWHPEEPGDGAATVAP
jgi:hypothetical protein